MSQKKLKGFEEFFLQMLELGSNKFVTVSEFRGKKLIQIREYYLDKVKN